MDDPLRGIEVEPNAREEIAERNAQEKRRYESTETQRPVPRVAPRGSDYRATQAKSRGPQNRGEQHGPECKAERRETRGIQTRPCYERSACAENQPQLIEIPRRVDDARQSAALWFSLRNKPEYRS